MPLSKSESKELAARYRQYEREALQEAENARGSSTHDGYLQLAAGWRKLAEEHERNSDTAGER
jgi:hypothetical protein